MFVNWSNEGEEPSFTYSNKKTNLKPMEANRIPWNYFAASVSPWQSNTQPEGEKILIVEEHPVVFNLLQRSLISNFPILFCQSHAALWQAYQEQPKLIVLHIEHEQAIELSIRIKTNQQTNDIPVMLLGEDPQEHCRREAYEAGVDEYWTAPLCLDDFMVRARNLMHTRQVLREKFSHTEESVSLTGPLSRDDRSLQKMMDTIHRQMPDSNFNVSVLARETGMSLTQLYRKCTSLTGRSPNELIRQCRLMKAAELLLAQFGNVSEVAYQVGFSNLSYFTKCFKGQFECLPSAYQKSATP